MFTEFHVKQRFSLKYSLMLFSLCRAADMLVDVVGLRLLSPYISATIVVLILCSSHFPSCWHSHNDVLLSMTILAKLGKYREMNSLMCQLSLVESEPVTDKKQ